jgi:hypothetical protein
MSWSPMLTNTTSLDGVFSFTSLALTNSSKRFYRALNSP